MEFLIVMNLPTKDNQAQESWGISENVQDSVAKSAMRIESYA